MGTLDEELSGTLDRAGDATVRSLTTDQLTVGELVGKLEAGNGSAQSISDNSTTKVNWSSVEKEDSNIVSVSESNEEITVQKDGDYVVYARLLWNSDSNWTTGDETRVMVFFEGSEEGRNRAPKVGTGAETKHVWSYLDGLSANDTIDIRVRQKSGSTINLRQNISDTEWTFSVYKVA